MALYNVIIKNVKTNEERICGQITAKNQREAKVSAFRNYKDIDYTKEQLFVVRR